MARLLFLLPFAPRSDLPHGGRLTSELLARLVERHELALICLRQPGEGPVDAALRRRCALVEELPLPARRAFGRSTLAAIARRTPLEVVDAHVPEFSSRVRSVAGDWQPDIVQIELVKAAQYLPALAGLPVARLLVHHDPGTETAREVYEASRGVERLVRRLDLHAWRRYERAALAAVDAVVVFTARDHQVVRAMAEAVRIETIPVGADVLATQLDAVGVSPPRLLFVGGYGHPPNVDAAVRLARGIFPRLRELHPGLVLDLVGAQPPASVRALASERIVVAGRVPDTLPYLDRAAVVAAPIRLGGGMRLKVLDALTAGKALVASPRAVEGLDVTDGEHLLIAASDAEFAERIDALLADSGAREALGVRARAWAVAHAGWDKPVAAFERLYASMLER